MMGLNTIPAEIHYIDGGEQVADKGWSIKDLSKY